MFQNIENLKLLSIVRATSSTQPFHMVNRPSHLFLLKISGEGAYSFENQTLYYQSGDLVFVPQGSSYTGRGLSPKGETLCINFEATIPDAVPQVHSLEGYTDLEYLYDHLEKMWLFSNPADLYKCYALFYHLISFISTKKTVQYAYQKKLDRIKPAVDYLRAHIFDCDLKVDQLHLLCGVSDTYFRQIFKANFGVTPQEYIINTRMTRALNRLLCKPYISISEVALSVGYRDALYFSRLFSKKHGFSPSSSFTEFHPQ